MTFPLVILVGLLFGAAAYLMLERNLVRFLFGLVLLGTAANLMLFVAGGLTPASPAIVPEGADRPDEVLANALPQALILTAIVISFALLAFALVLAVRANHDLGTVDTDHMRDAEPPPDERDPEAAS
ncbi:MAG: Na+/H+ antiporter subunit C [Planctomycetota bacterium]|nr:Na+/H+ antiporter subunit C [Planctomycetota bacterium]